MPLKSSITAAILTKRVGETESDYLERSIVRPIVTRLAWIPNSYVIKKHGNQFGKKGEPDILFWCAHPDGSDVCLSFVFEAKRRGRNPTPIQKVRLQRFARAKVVTAVVRSVDEVRAFLGSFGIEM